MVKENVSVFFYNLRVRNSQIVIQNKKGTKDFGTFYYTKIFAWGNFLSKVKKSTALRKLHYTRYKTHIGKNLDSESYCFFCL